MPLPSWQVFDRIRAFFRHTNYYRLDSLYQDQTDVNRITSGANFLELTRASGLLDQTNLQINRLERYKDYDMMDEVGEITLALDIYADESSLIDSERKHAVIVKAKSKQVKERVEDLFYNTLLIDRDLRPIVRYLCKYGDFPAEVVLTKNRDGVSSLRFINVYNFTRLQTKFGDLVGFFYQDPNTMAPQFLHPWQVLHLRLTSYESAYHPYGRSIIDGSRKDFKRLRLMEDAALIYRVTRAPEKRMFSIPVGNIPNTQVYHYITQIARQFKKHKFVDPATGQVNERYAPLIQEDDFFLPKRPGGEGPTIETLPGAQNLDQIEDILYFKKKMIAGTKIPFSRVGIGEQTESDTRSVASSSPEFAKAVQWVQREVAIGLKKIAIIDLALRGFSVDEIKDLDLTMTAASAIDELYRIETWNTRSEVIGNLKESGLFTDDWILGRFTDMTKDEIAENQINRDKQAEKEAKAGGGEEVAAPPGLSLGEAVDDEDKMLIMEYNDLIKNGGIKQYREVNQGSYTPNPSWYVNQNELDGLADKDGTKIVDSGVENTVVEEVCNEVKKILDPSLSNQEHEEIKIISQKMLPQEQQLIAEEQSDAKIH